MREKNCPHTEGCEMFPLFRLKSALDVWKTNYCEGEYENCARHRRSCEGAKVEQNLLPNGKYLHVDGK